MSLPFTSEMNELWDKIEPYLDEHMRLPENVPSDIKAASDRLKQLSKEQEEFALSL